MSVGHTCTGGGANISDSPIVINIHIYGGDLSLGQKIGRALRGLIGSRVIDGADRLSSDELQGRIVREIGN